MIRSTFGWKSTAKVRAHAKIHISERHLDSSLSRQAGNKNAVSRSYRRDYFDPGDWVRSRRPTRFVENLRSTWRSGLLRQISLHIKVLACFTTFVVVYNNMKMAQLFPFRLSSILPKLELPVLPFTLASASLGLLLTFRTNVCYQRWNEARSAWYGVS